MARTHTLVERLQKDLFNAQNQIVFLNGVISGLRQRNDKQEMERNPEANCVSCPYYAHGPSLCRKSPEHLRVQVDDYCGEHPNFWRPTKGTEQEQIAQVMKNGGRT